MWEPKTLQHFWSKLQRFADRWLCQSGDAPRVRIQIHRKFLWVLGLCCVLVLSGCSLPRVSAESRLFLNLSLALVQEIQLPQSEFQHTSVGGFSALTYDPKRDRFYALTDDDIHPRFYTLKLGDRTATPARLDSITVEAVTNLSDPLPTDRVSAHLDGEGIALTDRGSVFVASEGEIDAPVPPRLSEFQIASGDWKGDLTLPKQYGVMPDQDKTADASPDETLEYGVRANGGFESLAVNVEGDRLFAATEVPLKQDEPTGFADGTPQYYSRFLHYWIGEPEPFLVAEHLYPLDPPAEGSSKYGLSDLIPIDNGGHFLSLERSYHPQTGYGATLYQFTTGIASDTARTRTLLPEIKGITPIMKQPLLNLRDLNLPLQNLEGISLGPHLENGQRSVVLVSDNGFDPKTPTQFLIFRLEQHPQQVTKG